MKVFVYGATGLVGGALKDLLLEEGHEVWAGSRNPEKGEKKPNLHWTFADPKEPKQGNEVLESVDVAFLLSPPGLTNQYEILSPWIEKAKAVSLQKLILMTAMGVEHAPPEAPMRKSELLLEGSGLSWNILRPNWFMQNFHTFWIAGIKQDGKIYFPGGTANVSFIDARDIARVAKDLFTKKGFENQALPLTGSESINHSKVAEHLSNVSGRKIEYIDIDPIQFEASLVQAGLPKDYAGFLVYIADSLKQGFAAPIFDTVEKVTGKPAGSFANYAKDFANAWK